MVVLRRLRRELDISQVDFAKKLGVTQGTVSQWEKGRSYPRSSMLPKIAAVLGCTVDELLRKEG